MSDTAPHDLVKTHLESANTALKKIAKTTPLSKQNIQRISALLGYALRGNRTSPANEKAEYEISAGQMSDLMNTTFNSPHIHLKPRSRETIVSQWFRIEGREQGSKKLDHILWYRLNTHLENVKIQIDTADIDTEAGNKAFDTLIGEIHAALEIMNFDISPTRLKAETDHAKKDNLLIKSTASKNEKRKTKHRERRDGLQLRQF